jgi:hypothetical protein
MKDSMRGSGGSGGSKNLFANTDTLVNSSGSAINLN